MKYWIQWFLIVNLLLLTNVALAQSNKATPPSIFSSNLSSVTYLKEQELKWKIIVVDQKKVQRIWVNRQQKTIVPQKTVVLEEFIEFNFGKNSFLVEAENTDGIRSEKEFIVYFSYNSSELQAMKNRNLPPKDRPSAFFVGLSGETRRESNAPRFSDDVIHDNATTTSNSIQKYDDVASNVNAIEFNVGYRVKPENDNYTLEFQYAYLSEIYEDKEISEDSNFKDLGLQAHSFTGQYTQQQKRFAWGASYTMSFFDGNTKSDNTSEDTTDNGDKAFFHYVVPTFTYVHSEMFTSNMLLTLMSRSFQKDPDESKYDRDSPLSAGGEYQLFSFFPEPWGRLKGSINYFSDRAEGEFQRFSQYGGGADYLKSWSFNQLNSELQGNVSYHRKRSDYDNKYKFSHELTDTSKEGEERATLEETSLLSAAWIYNKSLSLQFAYRNLNSISTFEEFTYRNEGVSLRLSWNALF